MRPLAVQLPEFGRLAEAAHSPSEGEVRAATDSKVSSIARKVLPGVGVFLFLAGAFDFFSTASVPKPVLAATWLAAIAVLAIAGAIWRGRIENRHANAAVATAIGAVVAQAAIRLATTSLALPTIHVVLVIIIASSVILSWRCLATLLAGSFVSWNLALWAASWPQGGLEISPFAGALGLSMLVAIAIHKQRLGAYRTRFCGEIVEAQYKKSMYEVQRRYESAVRGANDGLWYWELSAEQIFVSARWAQMAGYPEGAVRLTPDEWWESVDPYYLEGLRQAFAAHLEGRSSQFEYKYRLRTQDGNHIWVLTRGLAMFDENGAPKSIAGSMTDISHVIEIEQRLVNDALQDKLTGLANRHRLTTELEFAVEESRETGKLIALIFLDLDDFKLVNDSLGHPVGDQLLSEVARRLWTCTRPTDTLARYGGDEFVLLLDGIDHPSDAEAIGVRMQEALAKPIEVDAHCFKVSASVGVAVNAPAVERHDELLRNADIAMYKSKSEGKGLLRVFNAEMHSQARRSWELNNTVKGLVERDEGRIHYQPIVSPVDGRVIAAEALFRWKGPMNAQRPTSELILAAERTGTIIEIGEWVLRKVCADAKSWQRRGLPPIKVAVNVSAHQLRLPDFADTVGAVLAEVGLEPHWLELELTETAFMHDIETVCSNLERLTDLGVGLAVDDFGTGYSSLGYLARFPLKTLKIDGSFISGIPGNPQTAALTRGVIFLAHSLGLRVTAEKVENTEQLEFLTLEGCDAVQGYLASKPLEAHEMAELLQEDEQLLPLVEVGKLDADRVLQIEFFRRALTQSGVSINPARKAPARAICA